MRFCRLLWALGSAVAFQPDLLSTRRACLVPRHESSSDDAWADGPSRHSIKDRLLGLRVVERIQAAFGAEAPSTGGGGVEAFVEEQKARAEMREKLGMTKES